MPSTPCCTQSAAAPSLSGKTLAATDTAKTQPIAKAAAPAITPRAAGAVAASVLDKIFTTGATKTLLPRQVGIASSSSRVERGHASRNKELSPRGAAGSKIEFNEDRFRGSIQQKRCVR